jgi:hypothetical protein
VVGNRDRLTSLSTMSQSCNTSPIVARNLGSKSSMLAFFWRFGPANGFNRSPVKCSVMRPLSGVSVVATSGRDSPP